MSIRNWLEAQRASVDQQLAQHERSPAVRFTRNFLEDDPDGLASMLAFAALFSLMPILATTFLVVTTLLGIAAIESEILELIADDVPPAIAEAVSSLVNAGIGNRTLVGLMTLATFILGGTRLYTAMDRACAIVFRAPRRSKVRRRIFTLIAMPLIPLLLLAATVVAVAATSILTLPFERLFDVHPSNEQTALIYLSSFLLAFSLFFLAYWHIPVRNPGARAAAEAGAVTAVLIVLLAQFFPLYIRLTGGYNIYGGIFGFVLLLMFWLYLVGHIFVIGAEIAAYRSGIRVPAPSQGTTLPLDLTASDSFGSSGPQLEVEQRHADDANRIEEGEQQAADVVHETERAGRDQ